MRKNILSTIILAVSLSLAFLSCDSSEKPGFSLDGEWVVYEKNIKCFEDGVETDRSKRLQDRFQAKFDKQIKTNMYIYKFGDIVSTQDGTYEYSETEKERASGSEIPVFKLSGYYKNVVDGLVMVVELGIYDNWEFKNEIIDLNHEHVAFTQNLTSLDLEIMSDLFLGSSGAVGSKMTGVLKTKAGKNKKVD